MNPQELVNTLSGGITQFQAILDAMKAALDIATNGYISDQAFIEKGIAEAILPIQKQLDEANNTLTTLTVLPTEIPIQTDVAP